MEVRLAKGESLRIYGPAEIEIRKGEALILGSELGPGSRAKISRHRSYTIEPVGNETVFSLSLEHGGSVEKPGKGEDPHRSWVELADMILDAGAQRIVVVGPVDAGKTSFTALASNRAIIRGLAPGIIDADIGQADIGPPGFTALAMPESWVLWLRSLDPLRLRMIGSIEPGPVAGRVIASVVDHYRHATEGGADIVVVDTDGWVSSWSAVEFKIDLVDAIDADTVVVMGDESLYKTLRRAVSAEVYKAESPVRQATRNTSDRRMLRSENYRRFLDGEERDIDLREVRVQAPCIAGDPIDDSPMRGEVESLVKGEIHSIREIPGGICIVLKRGAADIQAAKLVQKKLQVGDVIIVSLEQVRGLLAALRDRESNDHPALVENVDLDAMRITVRTRYKGPVERVLFGRIRLNQDYLEDARGRLFI